MAASETLVIGVGNMFRCDDAAGLLVVRALKAHAPSHARIIEEPGGGTELLAAWKGADSVIIVDAMQASGLAGEILRFDASGKALSLQMAKTSTHALSIGDTIELARVLGELPRRVIVYGIVGANFEMGESITPAVRESIEAAAKKILNELNGG